MTNYTTEKFTYFWNGPFSQWYPANFTIDKVWDMNCAEQWMMYWKAIVFRDLPTAQSILNTKNPKEQKALGRAVKNFDPVRWNQDKRVAVYRGNYAKFTQNPHLLKALMETKGTTLVEASPYDTIWGIGLAETDPRAKSRATWRGQNLLGEILTQLREDLIKEGR
jgi:ribA/ribD-fused uncharacterized protein